MSTTALKRPLKRRDKEYKGSSNDYFKTPRSTSQTIYVGGAPQTPGTGSGGGAGESEEGSFG